MNTSESRCRVGSRDCFRNQHRTGKGGAAMALTESTMELKLGTLAPDFALPDVVTGKTVRRNDLRGEKALLVMFICTHCPYVKHVEKGLAALGIDYEGKPVGMVAI